jgi:hypothetical protein
VAARRETLAFLERLAARGLDRRGRRQEADDVTVAWLLTAIAEYEEEQVVRIQRLREELGLPVGQDGPSAASPPV